MVLIFIFISISVKSICLHVCVWYGLVWLVWLVRFGLVCAWGSAGSFRFLWRRSPQSSGCCYHSGLQEDKQNYKTLHKIISNFFHKFYDTILIDSISKLCRFISNFLFIFTFQLKIVFLCLSALHTEENIPLPTSLPMWHTTPPPGRRLKCQK